MLHTTKLQKVLLISLLVLLITSQASTVSAGTNSVETALGVWEIVSSPTTNSLWSLDFSSPTSGWAGGDNVLLRYNGTSWQTFSVPALGTNYFIGSISMLSDMDGWLVGRAIKSNPYPETIVFHWDGAQWNEVASPTIFALWTVSAADAGHVFTAGGATLCNPNCDDLIGRAYLWNGGSWTSTPVGPHREIRSLSMAADGDGWMVGSEKDISTNQYQSLIMRWVNGIWQRVTTPAMNSNWLQAVSILDTNHAWAVGGYATIMWNGSAWNLVPFTWPSSPHILNDVQGVSAHDAWVVGEMGTILHWDGSSLAVSSNPATVDLNKVANSSPTDIWAVGMNGTILHYEEPGLKISGNAGVDGATLSYVDGGPQMVTSSADGSYSINIPNGWSGTVIPSKIGYYFSPVNRTYPNVYVDQTDQDYTAVIAPYQIYLPLVIR